MAAQERTKQAQHKPTSPPSNDADLLMTLDAPNDPPPPAFDTSFLPAAPAKLPPPAFDSVDYEYEYEFPSSTTHGCRRASSTFIHVVGTHVGTFGSFV
jgi:hypothetical protein